MSACRPRSRRSASSRGTACRTPRPSRCSSGCTSWACPSSSMRLRFSSTVSGDVVEELVLVERAVRAALGTRSVVGDHDDDRVLELPGLLEVVEQPPDLVVGVGDEAGEHLGHAGEEPSLVVARAIPRADEVELRPGLAVRAGDPSGSPWGLIGESSMSSGSSPERLLVGQDPRADGLVALVEVALVPVGPLLEHVVRARGRSRGRST